MPKKIRCVCFLISKIALYWGNQVEGEIYFKHSPKCKSKTQGTYQWTGAGYEEVKGGQHG